MMKRLTLILKWFIENPFMVLTKVPSRGLRIGLLISAELWGNVHLFLRWPNIQVGLKFVRFVIWWVMNQLLYLSFSHCRPHRKVKEMDMLHAADYANMSYDQMNRKMAESKKNDESIACAMQYIQFLIFHEILPVDEIIQCMTFTHFVLEFSKSARGKSIKVSW